MKEFWNVCQTVFAGVGAWLGYFLGGCDGLIYALLVFIIVDYLTGVMVAINNQQLSSSVGFRGLCRKAITFMLVGVGHILDMYILKQPGVLRTAIIFWALANNGLSITENATQLGLPVPIQLKEVLEQLHDRAQKNGSEGEIGGEDDVRIYTGKHEDV